ncbi:ABC transporter permease, partial [Mesorhizobium sp. M8A.F.Ca.ET.023.01.1.1]
MTVIDGTLKLDPEEARRVRQERLERIGRWVLPLAIMILAIWLWDRICVWNEIPQYILPRPGVV